MSLRETSEWRDHLNTVFSNGENMIILSWGQCFEEVKKMTEAKNGVLLGSGNHAMVYYKIRHSE